MPSKQQVGRKALIGSLGAFAFIAVGISTLVVTSAFASSPMTPSATTQPAAVHGGEATLAGTINDEGTPTDFNFEWRELHPSESLEDAFPSNAPAGNVTARQALSASSEPQQVSVVIGSLSPFSEYAYRVVAESETKTGTERTYGQTLSFSMPGTKDSPIERVQVEERLRKERELRSPSGSTGSQTTAPNVYCRAPRLKGLTLSHATKILKGHRCGTLTVAARQSGRSSSTIISQSPHAHAVISTTTTITVWLRNPGKHRSRR
jgi:hypothetical protein